MKILIDESKYMSKLAQGILKHLKRFLEEKNLQNTTLIAEQNICGQRIDFSFPELKNKVFIEVHGEQHFKEVKHWGGKEGLEKRKILDRNKKELIEVKYPDSILIEFGYKKITYKDFLKTMGSALDYIEKEDIKKEVAIKNKTEKKTINKSNEIKIREVKNEIKVRR